jgi:hypothetical protein
MFVVVAMIVRVIAIVRMIVMMRMIDPLRLAITEHQCLDHVAERFVTGRTV